MRILLVGEGLVEGKDLWNAGIALPTCKDAVREHQDLGRFGREVPTLPVEAVEDGLKRALGGLWRKIAAPVAAGAALAGPGVGVKDADLALRVRIDDGLGQFGPHPVQAVDDGRELSGSSPPCR